MSEVLQLFRDSCRGASILMARADLIHQTLKTDTPDDKKALANAIKRSIPTYTHRFECEDIPRIVTPHFEKVVDSVLDPQQSDSYQDYELLAAIPVMLYLHKTPHANNVFQEVFQKLTAADLTITPDIAKLFPLIGSIDKSDKSSFILGACCEEAFSLFESCGIVCSQCGGFKLEPHTPFLEVFDSLLKNLYTAASADGIKHQDYLAIQAVKRMTYNHATRFIFDNNSDICRDRAFNGILTCLQDYAYNNFLDEKDVVEPDFLYHYEMLMLTKYSNPFSGVIYSPHKKRITDSLHMLEYLKVDEFVPHFNEIYNLANDLP
jgi:hypothetical protein